ncbi:MAG: antirepressor regulating drug resistance protein, partial [Anaerocolumna sp.]|nr:antirepressor regulating drug resistance protein [Anaerocolumna sp.]
MDGLVHMFLKVLNMSLSATIVISIVILLRFLLKKMPKRYSYVLWFVVFIRLLVPISVESRFSIIPQNASETFYEKLVSFYDLIYQDIAAILPKTTLKTNMNVQVKQNTQGSSSHNTDSDASQNSTYSNETLNPNDNRTVSTIDNKTTNINKTNFNNVNNQLFQQYLRVISYIWIGVAIVFLFSSFVR